MNPNEKLFGFYRAKVIGNKDTEYFGRIVIWIPEFMPEISDKNVGLIARPANNMVGGRNEEGDSEHHFMGTSYVPKNGSWIWVFFEAGNVNKPYYFSACDLENSKILPECQVGDNHEDKWVIFKSHEGRCIVISDDPDDARVEITGKKRKLKDMPSGDTSSVYEINENQTTILLDERKGKEKLLIKTYKGDYINIDIETKSLNVEFAGDIFVKANNIHIEATTDIRIKALQLFQESVIGMSRKAGATIIDDSAGLLSLKAGGITSIQAGGLVTIDGTEVQEMSGGSSLSAEPAEPDTPIGDR